VVFEDVCTELENEGYEVQAFIIPAAGVNALHKRERIFFIAYSKRAGLEYRDQASNLFKQEKQALREGSKFTNEFKANCRKLDSSKYSNLQSEYILCRGLNGVSGTLDGITFPKWRKESIKSYGNAIVPQVAFEIFKTINTFESIENNI
jgi:DNA (cytosine-5)-methyltransferase 1